MTFVYQAVERIPKQLDSDVVYHSKEFELAALLCACGCGHKVMLLVPDSHRVTSKNGLATIRPSIAVCDAPCKSHYVISNGQVNWLDAFSNARARNVMRNQITRHVGRDVKPLSFGDRVRAAIARSWTRGRTAAYQAYAKLKSIIGK